MTTQIAYKVVADRMIEMVTQSGALPWRKPWANGMSTIRGKNRVSGKAYRGINAVMTGLASEAKGYSCNEWISYKQALELGGQVRKGEKGLPILYFTMLNDKKDPSRKIPLARYSVVFNLEQVDGIEYAKLAPKVIAQHERIPLAESLLAKMKHLPEIRHVDQSRAYYQPSTDHINVPSLESFPIREEYYSTLFHEVIHSTGHKDRLARTSLTKLASFGSHEYSKEELIAEFGACFLQSDCGLLPVTQTNSAAYLQNWVKVLRDDPKMLVEGANQAQKAVDYLLGE